MKFFHGSRDENLTELVTTHSRGKVYLTDSYAFAFLYGACSLRLWGWDEEHDRPIFREVGKDCFKIQFQNAKCYIYECQTDEAEKQTNHSSGHVFVLHKNIKVRKIEVIEDAYQKLLQLEKEGKVTCQHWEDYSKEQQKEVAEEFYEQFAPIIEDEKKMFPEEYELMVKICPRLKVEGK